MAMTQGDPRNAKMAATALCAAALLALPLIGGCAQSASTRWAQNSAVIAPSKRPPALTAFSAIVVVDKEEVQ